MSPLTSTQQSLFIRTGEVIHLTVFSIYYPKPALLAHTPPTLTHSSTTAVHIRTIWSALPVWISIWVLNQPMIWPLLLFGTVLGPTARWLVVIMTASCWSTTAVTFRVNPNNSRFIVTYRANSHSYIFIFTVVRASTHANGDVEVNLHGKIYTLVITLVQCQQQVKLYFNLNFVFWAS